MIIKGGSVFTSRSVFEKNDVYINGGIISENADSADVIDASDMLVIPGFIDIHTHGAVGYNCMDASCDSFRSIAKFHAENGTTTFLATGMTESFEALSAMTNIAKETQENGTGGAEIGGVYLEGPYFALAKIGAQDPKFARDPDTNEFEKINESGFVRVISLAPERNGALDFIEKEKSSVKIALGHTDSDYDTAMSAIASGASIITHTFNAMSGFSHRKPGVVGAAIDTDVYCECICDGFHLSPTAVRLLYKTKGRDKMVMITDMLSVAGLPDGEYQCGGLNIAVVSGKAYLAETVKNGTENATIAGSTSTLLDDLKFMTKIGIPLEDAIKMATANPANAIGLCDRGVIEAGKRADIIILDKELSLRHVIIGGKLYK